MRKYWELWKDGLAAWATVAIAIYIITLVFGVEHILAQLLDQLQLVFLLTVILTYIIASFLFSKTSQWAENHRRSLGIGLATTGLISLIVWLIFAETWPIWTQAFLSLIPLVLWTFGMLVFFHKQPCQPKEPPSKEQETEEAPSTPKRDSAKIIGITALLILLLAIVLTRKKRE